MQRMSQAPLPFSLSPPLANYRALLQPLMQVYDIFRTLSV
jgi:hypothetical protein